jgi:3-hydroxyacyl-CoA dehydrogenase/enoyl-CoA hydratase/3-hydroxybutyryl-CoA epimerase
MEINTDSRKHWKIAKDEDGIIRLQIDRANSSINTLSAEVIEELDGVLDEICMDPPKGLILCSAKSNGFIAGADVREFAAIIDAGEGQARVERVHSIFARIEQLPFPTVCLIHGFCLGGGLELALACHSIIAVDAPETQLGLPEVNLGIHPGFGGTVRLIRRIGPLRALDMMLSGRSLNAHRALQIGLVDAIVPERQSLRAARRAVLKPATPPKPPWLHSLLSLQPFRLLISRYLQRKLSARVDRMHYPAPYALLDLWEKHGGNEISMDHEEARSVVRLVMSPNAQNLVRVFQLRERLQSLGRQTASHARSVHVIGAGTMGGDIAAWCALQGFRVTLQDIDSQRLAAVIKRASILFSNKLKNRRFVEESLDRLIPDPRGDGLSKADVVIEAIFEDAAAKRNLYGKIEPMMRQDALLATNTSSIPMEELVPSLLHPARFVGLHFFNPVAKMPLVEVVRGKNLGDSFFCQAIAFISAIHRLPLPVASSPGFLVNRILTPYLLEAVLMEQEGIPAVAIDRAATAFGMPMGPLLLADTVGLDICLSVGRNLAGHFDLEIPKNLENLVSAGRLGKKAGRGFFIYENGKQKAAVAKRNTPPDKMLADRMMLRLLNESVACLCNGIVQDGDLLDAGAIFGMGFAPFLGGPMHYIRREGVESCVSGLRALEQRYGKRFSPDPGWQALANKYNAAPAG